MDTAMDDLKYIEARTNSSFVDDNDNSSSYPGTFKDEVDETSFGADIMEATVNVSDLKHVEAHTNSSLLNDTAVADLQMMELRMKARAAESHGEELTTPAPAKSPITMMSIKAPRIATTRILKHKNSTLRARLQEAVRAAQAQKGNDETQAQVISAGTDASP